jgi:hypothetical protein
MAAAPLPRYLYNIPSIRDAHPDLPNAIGQVDLDQAIEAGTEVNRQHLAQARAVATALKGISGETPKQIFDLSVLSCRTQTVGTN